MRNLKLTSLTLVIFLVLQSCVQIFDEIIVHNDGSGTYKYTVNLSASKIKINSVLALDSIDGKRVPKIPEVKEKIALYIKKLEAKEGISNVKVEANYIDFIFKFSCDFTNVAALQEGIREVVKEEVDRQLRSLLHELLRRRTGVTFRVAPRAHLEGRDRHLAAPVVRHKLAVHALGHLAVPSLNLGDFTANCVK